MLDDAVATQDTVTQLVAAIRRVLRVVPGAEAVLVGRETACDHKPGRGGGKPARPKNVAGRLKINITVSYSKDSHTPRNARRLRRGRCIKFSVARS